MMKRLVFAVDTLPVSTAASERGFSRMNVVCSPLRTRLSIVHLSLLMFVGMEGPPMSSFETSNNIVNLKSGLEVTQCH